MSVVLPELAPLAEALAGRALVLDSGLAARQGRSWASTRWDRGSTPTAPEAVARGTLAIFDLLVLDGAAVTDAPYRERRRLLEALEL